MIMNLILPSFFFLFFSCSPVRHDVTQTDIGRRRRKVYNPPLSKLSIYLPTIFIRHLIEEKTSSSSSRLVKCHTLLLFLLLSRLIKRFDFCLAEFLGFAFFLERFALVRVGGGVDVEKGIHLSSALGRVRVSVCRQVRGLCAACARVEGHDGRVVGCVSRHGRQGSSGAATLLGEAL